MFYTLKKKKFIMLFPYPLCSEYIYIKPFLSLNLKIFAEKWVHTYFK